MSMMVIGPYSWLHAARFPVFFQAIEGPESLTNYYEAIIIIICLSATPSTNNHY